MTQAVVALSSLAKADHFPVSMSAFPWLILFLFLLGQTSFSQPVRVIKYAELEKWLASAGDTTLVVNFWATWCKPCLEELPYFEQVQTRYASRKVKVLLVSMDVAAQLEKKVIPFVQKRRLHSTVLLLDEPDANTWIDKLHPDWSGALPFTVIHNQGKGKHQTYEGAFTFAQLETALQGFVR